MTNDANEAVTLDDSILGSDPDPVPQAGQTVAEPDFNNPQLVSEELPSLSELAQEPSSGAWPNGWYKAKVLEGYATNSGYQWETKDSASKDGASRNMQVCFAMTNTSGETRNIFSSFNYRLTDFTPQKIAAVKELRAAYAGKKGKWAESDIQRTSLAIAKLGQLERAFDGKVRFKRSEMGNIVPANLVGYDLDLHITINDESGYNDVSEYAKSGEKTDKKVKK